MRWVSTVAGWGRRWLLVPGEGRAGLLGLPLMAVSSPCGRGERLGLKIADMKVGREPSSL
jgi:hypothetical protein